MTYLYAKFKDLGFSRFKDMKEEQKM